MKTKIYSRNWICTDASTKQYGRQLSETIFEFKEGSKREIIDLNNYKISEIESCINSYGYSLHPTINNIYSQYNDFSNWVIAECLFEIIC